MVEPVRPSGFQGDIYVFDEEFGFAEKTSMFLRVIGLGPECCVRLGGVYVCPVYCWEPLIEADGTEWLIGDERNLKAEVEGYDE